ncbi:hypothetical protein [Actinomadura bangladeshensis]|uniref:Uncharacterized protein n=1 Tax=Actinomadura bangladeshensis TaxID=453573 RepID=A0A6L9QAZ0_9ACTN|nr:hypothetical protein [Actinomadura bangladeshensis]NEA22640.1 hypothetical protein [Actinomadura bangladeshensis]
MSKQTVARETRLVEDTTSLIDYTSRFLGAVEAGNWRYAADKLGGLRSAVERLEHDLDRAHAADLRHINGAGVWARVERLMVPFWLGRAIAAWNSKGVQR